MKVVISIDQQAKSSMFGLGSTKHSYKLNVQFKLNEKEKKIFNEHPLFQDMIVMEYSVGKKKDIPVFIKAKDLYAGTPIVINTATVNDLIEFRDEFDKAAKSFISYVDVLSEILGGKELVYGE